MSSLTEVPLMKEFLTSYRHVRVRLFRRNVIDKTVRDIHTDKILQMKAAIKGQADVYGYVKRPQLTLAGKFYAPIPFEIEFKGHRTIISPAQRNWRAWCAQWSIPYLVFRAGLDETTNNTLERWTQDLNRFVLKVDT